MENNQEVQEQFGKMVNNMKKLSPNKTNSGEYYEYIFSRDQLQNLMIFLNRTNLAGTEVPAFNELMTILLEDPPPCYKSIEEKIKDVDITLLKNEVDRRENNF